MNAKYTLVGVIDAEVADPGARYGRRDRVREALWALVESGKYPGFDEALADYAEGRIAVPTETMSDIHEALLIAVLTSEPSRYALNLYASRIESIGSESPYARIAVDALRRGDAQTGLGMVQAALNA